MKKETRRQFIERVVKDCGCIELTYRNAIRIATDNEDKVIVTYLVGYNGYECKGLDELDRKEINLIYKDLAEDFV